jgi:hypothetical protein
MSPRRSYSDATSSEALSQSDASGETGRSEGSLKRLTGAIQSLENPLEFPLGHH